MFGIFGKKDNDVTRQLREEFEATVANLYQQDEGTQAHVGHVINTEYRRLRSSHKSGESPESLPQSELTAYLALLNSKEQVCQSQNAVASFVGVRLFKLWFAAVALRETTLSARLASALTHFRQKDTFTLCHDALLGSDEIALDGSVQSESARELAMYMRWSEVNRHVILGLGICKGIAQSILLREHAKYTESDLELLVGLASCIPESAVDSLRRTSGFDLIAEKFFGSTGIAGDYLTPRPTNPESQKPLALLSKKTQPDQFKKVWELTDQGLVNAVSKELIPKKYSVRVEGFTPGFEISSPHFSVVWISDHEILK